MGECGLETNGVAFGIGGKLTSANDQGQVFREYYESGPNGGAGLMHIYVPVSATGASNWTYTSGGTTYDYSSIDYEEFSVDTPSTFPSVVTNLVTTYDSGINVSSTYSPGTSISQVGWSTIWYLLGMIPAPYLYGWTVGSLSYEQNLYDNAGLNPNPSTGLSEPGNYTGAKFGLDNGQVQTGMDSVGSWGYDLFSVSALMDITINETDFSKSGTINFGAQNMVLDESNGILSTSSGAYSGLSLNVVPGYTIQGYAKVNGQPAANQELLLATSNFDYYVYTNSSGYFRFIGQPGVTYELESPTSSAGAIPVTGNSEGGTGYLQINFDTLTFSTSSNLYGNSWTVSINGPNGYQQSVTTSSSSVVFDVFGNTTYSYSVSAPSYWSVSPSSNSITLGSDSETVGLTFSPTQYWTITFDESGLPSGQQWNAKVDGVQKSTTGTSISFSEPHGSNPWSIPYVYYSTTLWYEPSPGSGTFDPPSSTSVSVTFYGVQQNPNSCVYAHAPVLLSNYSREYAENVSVGDSIMTYNFTSHQLEPGTVDAVFVTQHSNMYVINGYLKVAGDQDIWTNNGNIQAQNLTINDTIFDVLSHHFYKVHSISVEQGIFTMYDFYVSANHNYVVWSNLMEDRLP